MTNRLTICDRCGRTIVRCETVQISGIDFCPRCANYCSEFIRNDPWPDKAVDWLLTSMEDIDRLAVELKHTISKANDEKPLQEFFEKNPNLLVQLFRYGHGRWVFARPNLGGEYIPDFMMCGVDSAGPHWHLIELENPTYPVLRRDGQQRAEFTHAVKQVSEWKIWLRKNIQYAQTQLGYVGLDSEFKATIVMGRRVDILPEHRELYRELSLGYIEVMSYDRMLEQVFSAARGWRMNQDRLIQMSQDGKAT